jgi:hypothetical protein
MTIPSSLSKVAGVFLMLSFGGACGSLSTEGTDAASAGKTGGAANVGSAGVRGGAGNAGSAGVTGSASNAGSAGVTGSAGNAGNAGSVGVTGSAGSAGNAGSAGVTGSAGNAGNAGTTGTASTGGTGSDGGMVVGPTTPKIISTLPNNGAANVPLNGSISATFSEAMDPATFTATTFTLASGVSLVPVAGMVRYANSTVVFSPNAHLENKGSFTATVTTGAKSVSGVALAAKYVWTFTTGETVAAGLPVNLGSAGAYVILAKSGISTVPASAITGNLGVSPAAGTYITGFSLMADSTNVFSRSTQVAGKVYAANDAVPTPSNLTTAVGDMELAFTEAAGRAPGVTELGAGNIGGKTLPPGVYKWGTGLLIPTNVTLTGTATDVWIFQIAQSLTMSSAAKILLAGGALPKNVFWQVAGLVDIGTTAHLEGVVLTQTSVTLRTGASIKGRLLAQTAVALQVSTVVEPAP